MRKEHTMLVLNDGTITHKKIKGRRTLKFFKDCFKRDLEWSYTVKNFVVVGLFSNDRKGEITYVVKKTDDTRTFITNMYHMNISWRRLKKRLIADYTNEHYKRFY